jgi:hypothetical protein
LLRIAEYALRADWDFTETEKYRTVNSEWPVSVVLDGIRGSARHGWQVKSMKAAH